VRLRETVAQNHHVERNRRPADAIDRGEEPFEGSVALCLRGIIHMIE